MEESSRNSFNNLDKNNKSEGSYGSQGEDDKKLSPRSLEQVKEIGSGILQLVDDFDNHQHDEIEIQKQMDNLNIGSGNFIPAGQYSQTQGNRQYQNVHPFGQNYSQQTEFTGGTPFFPSYTADNQERIQGMVQGVGDFQQPFQQKKGTYSRQSSEGENGLTGNPNYHRLDYSEVAVHSGHKQEDNYSNKSWIDSTSDYQEQLEKYGFIYSPDQQFQRPQQINHNGQYHYNQYNYGFQNQGYYQQRPTQQQWDSYHQSLKPSVGFQNRASSHDKLAQQNNNYQPFVQQNLGYNNNEEFETHSAASSGNHSAFSEGDIYNPAFQTPNAYSQQYYQGQNYYGGPSSNQAMYGFTPNIQFSGSNQKYHPQSSAGMSMKIPTDQTIGSYEIFPDEINLQAQPSQSDIQITDLDVNLQGFKIGVSPRKNSNEVKSHSVQKMPQGNTPGGQYLGSQHFDSYSERNAHHHNQIHTQYKTPSPYRNNEMGAYNLHHQQQQQIQQQQQQINNTTKGLRIGPNHSEPFYPGYNFQNQRIAQQVYNKQPMYHGGARGQMNDQYSHIGMNAPPILRNIEFSHGESLIMNHNKPFPAVQPNFHPNQGFYPVQQQQYPVYAQNQQLAMKSLINSKTAGSQERDPNYQPLNFLPTPGQNSKTVVNTPKHNTSQEHNKSGSSVNSNNSQQFSTVLPDQNEIFLMSLTKQFDECQNPQQKYEIIKGQVHKLALNQKGSRFLQRQVTKATSNVISFFLEEISPYFKELMTDNYGNYFCQCLLQSCSGDQRLQILKSIETNFIEICCNSKGTHAIQKMFDLVNLPEEEDFIRNALLGNIMKLSIDPQGTHVVQKVLASFDEQKRAFIFDEIFDQFIDLAKNTNGLCVIKKLIFFTKEKSQSDALMQKIQENSNTLAQDMYGNYALAEIINNWDPEVCKPIFNALRPKVIQLCNQKYSSNVIEKCLEKADETIRSQFIQEMSISDKLTNTIRNQFGNFVIQRALKIAQGPDKEQLISAIKKCIPEIQDKRIRDKWERIIYDAINGTNTAIQQNQNDHLENDANSTGGGSTGHRQVTINQNNMRSNSSDNVQ